MHAMLSLMAQLTIRNVDDALKTKLRVRAARNGRSMEEEARQILRQAVASADHAPKNLGSAIHARFAPSGGVELPVPARDRKRAPPDFSK